MAIATGRRVAGVVRRGSARLLAINPYAKAPTIVDGDAVVFDSNAILVHLAEKNGRFLGAPADRPVMLGWLLFVATGLGPYPGQSVHFSRAHTGPAYATNFESDGGPPQTRSDNRHVAIASPVMHA